jgi:hypothetical protein
MIEMATLHGPAREISYLGVDQFEARTKKEGDGLKLKEAHCTLKASGARVRLVPGDPLSALARIANTTQGIDFLVVGADVDAESLARAWFYLPRMLSPQCVGFSAWKEGRVTNVMNPISIEEIGRLAQTLVRRRAA